MLRKRSGNTQHGSHHPSSIEKGHKNDKNKQLLSPFLVHRALQCCFWLLLGSAAGFALLRNNNSRDDDVHNSNERIRHPGLTENNSNDQNLNNNNNAAQQRKLEQPTAASNANNLQRTNKDGPIKKVPPSPSQIEHNSELQANYKPSSSSTTTTTSTTTSSTTTSSKTEGNVDEEVIESVNINRNINQIRESDKDCIFKDSPLYRKVYVYPNRDDPKLWQGDILSETGRAGTSPTWPWLEWQRQSQANATSHYDIESVMVQYATELLVRELMINKDSCLRTDNPEEATLFYVPYLPSMEHHQGTKHINNMTLSPFGDAILQYLDHDNITAWEHTWGLTGKYWERRKGADHILVFSEPMHGLWHPRSKRGNYHFVHSQKQLTPPIVISVELSTTFVQQYPQCSRKNILVPYPNSDGRWFNNYHRQAAHDVWHDKPIAAAAAPHDKEVLMATAQAAMSKQQALHLNATDARPVSQFYAAGNHGTCTTLRRALAADYRSCSPSFKTIQDLGIVKQHTTSMQLSTFCPCPGGDSPSAKRMYDAILAGCIPVVLSHDFVWPFTNEFDQLPDNNSKNDAGASSQQQQLLLDPEEFSVRLSTPDWNTVMLDPDNSCQAKNSSQPGLQHYLDNITADRLQSLRRGVHKAQQVYNWYQYRSDLPDNPLRQKILPDGGTAHAVVQALADRAQGVRWPACERELQALGKVKQPNRFVC